MYMARVIDILQFEKRKITTNTIESRTNIQNNFIHTLLSSFNFQILLYNFIKEQRQPILHDNE